VTETNQDQPERAKFYTADTCCCNRDCDRGKSDKTRGHTASWSADRAF